MESEAESSGLKIDSVSRYHVETKVKTFEGNEVEINYNEANISKTCYTGKDVNG